MGLKSVLKTRFALKVKGNNKLEALLQWEKLARLAEREAGRLVRRRYEKKNGENGGKRKLMSELTLRHIERFPLME